MAIADGAIISSAIRRSRLSQRRRRTDLAPTNSWVLVRCIGLRSLMIGRCDAWQHPIAVYSTSTPARHSNRKERKEREGLSSAVDSYTFAFFASFAVISDRRSSVRLPLLVQIWNGVLERLHQRLIVQLGRANLQRVVTVGLIGVV